MTKNLAFLVNLVILFFFSHAQTDSIVYENLSSKLILYTDSTFVFKNKGVDIARIQDIGDDTITYGKYVRYENKSLYLYSHPEIMSPQLDVIANFEERSNQDSILTIILSSPFSKQKRKHPELLEKAYFYLVDILHAGAKKSQFFSQISFSDTILIKHLPEETIEKISINIYPYQSIGLHPPHYSHLSLNYTLRDIHSNYVSLYVPKFTAYYMYYHRFYGKEVKIMDTCTISIEKSSILSRCKGKKFDKEWQFILYQLKNPYKIDE